MLDPYASSYADAYGAPGGGAAPAIPPGFRSPAAFAAFPPKVSRPGMLPGPPAPPPAPAFPREILDLEVQLQLPQAASLPPLGVYRGPLGIRKQDGAVGITGEGITAYETFLGRSCTYVIDYLWNKPNSTTAFTSGELAASNNADNDAGTAVTGWTGYIGSRTLMLGLPACIGTSAGAGATTWAQETTGKSDAYWTALGNTLISAGLGNAVLRIGREFNGNWFAWSPLVTGDSKAQYIAGWQHVVTLLRNLAGSHFTFQWNPILDPAEVYLSGTEDYYPGSAYVDSIGLDVYDWGGYSTITSKYGRDLSEQQVNWNLAYNNTQGIQQWMDFTRSLGRPLGFPEWGLQLWLQGSNYIGGGDDPYFIDQMAAVFAALGSRCSVAAFWEDDGMGLFDTDGYAGRTSGLPVPYSRAEFLALYGPSATATTPGWEDITSYVYQRSEPAVTITRGRPDEATSVNAASAAMEWNNRDGRFSPRNAAGPYYPDLTRNTPVRLSVPAGGTFLRFADDVLSSAGGAVSTEITGDIDIRLDLALDSYMDCILVTKYAAGFSSWALYLNGDGTLGLQHWDAGGTKITCTTAAAIPLGRTAVRVTLQVNVGGSTVHTWYTAPTITGTWTQIEQDTTAGITSIKSTPGVNIIIGDNLGWRTFAEPGIPSATDSFFTDSFGLLGSVYGLQVLAGVGGIATASPDFTSVTAGTTSFTDSAGTPWTLYGTAEISGRSYRFHGECSALPQRWDVTGTDVYVPVQAGGVLRRKNQGNQALSSALYRVYASPFLPWQGLVGVVPVAYWPCEDGSGATQIASGIGGEPMSVSGSASFASDSSFLCSSPIAAFNNSIWRGIVPPYKYGTDVVVRFLVHVTSSGDTDTARIIRVYTDGDVNEFSCYYGTGGTLGVAGYAPDGTNLFDSGPQAWNINDKKMYVSLELRKSGTSIHYAMIAMEVGASSTLSYTGTLASSDVGHCTQVWGDPYADLANTSCGHITVQSTWIDLFEVTTPLNAYRGEEAGYRVARLCQEEGITSRIYGFPQVTAAMGAQTPQTLQQLLQECETADGGMLYEPRETLGIGYRTLASITNQSPAATLTYTAAHLASPLEPTEDDQLVRNDVTVQQSGGGSSDREVLTAGALSVADPPAGAGRYDTQVTVSVLAGSQVNDVAGWLLHMGTVNQPRFPVIKVNMARSEVASLFWTLQGIDVGAFLDIASPPAWLPPGDIKQIISGVTEHLGGYTYQLAWNCAPELPYEVATVATGSAASDYHADTDASSLYAPVTSGATSLQVMTASANADYPLWTTDTADFPFDISINGEQITVTNITGTSSPQTFTVTRSVNGVVLAHQAGEAVSLYTAPIAALI